MHSNLINKMRNLAVEFRLRSGPTLAGRILDVDELFVEVEVRVDDKGQFVSERAQFEKGGGVRTDRVLLSLHDITLIR